MIQEENGLGISERGNFALPGAMKNGWGGLARSWERAWPDTLENCSAWEVTWLAYIMHFA